MSNKPKTVPVDDYWRSPPSPVPPGGRNYPKPGPKPIHVPDHRRSPPSPPGTNPGKKK